jgi:hypothetical protein
MSFRPVSAAILALAFAVMALTPAAAQDDSGAIKALILPMMSEVAPGPAAEIFTDCIIAEAQPAEIAALAAASGPSVEVGQLINTVLARPETLACAANKAQ